VARILLVEADPALRGRTAAQLRSGGHMVMPTECAESAVALVASLGCPEIVVIDVDPPGPDGLALLDTLRDEWCQRPVVAVIISDGALPSVRTSHGTDVVLCKPVSADALLMTVEAVEPGSRLSGVEAGSDVGPPPGLPVPRSGQMRGTPHARRARRS
jgi:putative two-component system response regulator